MDNKSLNYKYIKLSNGDNIMCMTDDDCKDFKKKKTIHILEPVLVTPFRFPHGHKVVETFVLQPWIPFTDEKVFEISTSSIIMTTDVVKDFKDQYEKYIEKQDSNESVQQEIVEELEEMLTRGRELEEDEPDPEPNVYFRSRTVH